MVHARAQSERNKTHDVEPADHGPKLVVFHARHDRPFRLLAEQLALVCLLFFNLCVDKVVGCVAERGGLVDRVDVGSEGKDVVGIGLGLGVFGNVTLRRRENRLRGGGRGDVGLTRGNLGSTLERFGRGRRASDGSVEGDGDGLCRPRRVDLDPLTRDGS